MTANLNWLESLRGETIDSSVIAVLSRRFNAEHDNALEWAAQQCEDEGGDGRFFAKRIRAEKSVKP